MAILKLLPLFLEFEINENKHLPAPVFITLYIFLTGHTHKKKAIACAKMVHKNGRKMAWISG
ncbi:hypothetical protein HMPREF3213_02841 [Heyndrickxia coagulans]|uniref:Uncharacterized protein n=1 Tax=Heyndrickxia coagulans TaxID=1398 RepID=A0A133KGX3_HEYCO|nr:hypothetical protein HMPREF3213_02841 [Heyndrickxia coagulans]